MMSKLTAAFKNRGFTGVFLAHVLGVFNDNISRAAFVALTSYKIYRSDPSGQWFWVFMGLVVFSIPFFLLSVFAGELADKTGRDTIIKYAKGADILLFIMLAAGLHFFNLQFMIFLLFLKGCQSAFFGPAKNAALKDLAGRENLLSANSCFFIGSCAAIFAGIAFGPAIARSGFLLPLLGVSSASGFLSAMLIPPVKVADAGHKISYNLIKINILNLRLSFHSRDLFLCTVGVAWFWLCASVLVTQLQVFFSGGAFSYMMLISTTGLAAGAAAAFHFLKGEVNTRFAPLSAVLMTVFIIDLAFALSGPAVRPGLRIHADIFLLSFFGGIFIVPVHSMLQAVARDKVRGRMLSVTYLYTTVFVAAGGAVSFSVISAGAGGGAILSLTALVNTFFSVAIVLSLPKHVIRSVITALLDFMYRIEIAGLEAFKNHKANAVIVANQNSFLDPLILAVFLPGRPYFAVDTATASKFWIKPFLKLIRYYVVDPENPMVVKSIIDRVKEGHKVVLFPEGRVSTTGGIMKIHPGLAMIADRGGADIIPVSIEGSQYSIFSRFGRKFKDTPSSRIKVSIYPARRLKMPEGLTSAARRAAAENALYDIMALMKFKSANTDRTIFDCLLDARGRMGRGFKFLEDINRKPLSLGMVLTGAFVLGRQFKKKTRPGEFAGLMLPTSNACAVAFLGMHGAGRVPAMINFSTGIKNVCDSCKTAGIKTVYSAQQFIVKADMQPMVDALEASGVEVILLDKLKISPFEKLFGLLMSFFPRFYYHSSVNAPAPEAPAVLLFTSGSEGTPKGVALSHKNLISNVYQMTSVIPFNFSDRMFCCMPLFHSFGLTGGFMVPLICGFSIFFYPTPLHYHIIPQLVYETNATVFFATDTFLSGYAKSAHPYDFHSVRYVAIGAEKLKDENFNVWARKFGIRVLELYGATETSPGISVSSPMHCSFGAVGRMVPGLEHRLEPVPGIDEGGRLFVKGDNVMLGYIKDDKPGVIQPVEGGWYDTGDIVDVDADGFVYIKGRAKRFAKVAGEMVPMLAVEMEITRLWPESHNAIAAVPDEKRGESIILYTTRSGAQRAELLKAFKDKGLPEIFVPKKIKTVESIPLLGNGKTDYVTLTARALEEEKESAAV